MISLIEDSFVKIKERPTHEHIYLQLLDPYRVDAVMGFTEFSKTFEQFAFSLLTESECVAAETDPVVYRKCTHAIIQVSLSETDDV